MTNETAHPENGVAHTDSAAIAALTTATAETDSAAATPAPEAAPKKPSFDDLGLHPDIKLALDEMGYFEPTAVQTAVYGPVSEGKDLMVQSRTGTGKTTAFGLPILSKIVPTHRQPQALILAPTRELALQVARELTNIGKHRGIVVEAIYGGAPIGKQITNLQNGVHVIVGTPGRVLDHIGRRTLDCKSINTFVLDECDEMLSMGFLEDIERVVSNLPDKKQTLLFSATMPDEVARYSRRHMTAPEQISLSRDQISVTDIHHAYYIVSGIARSRDLLKILYAEEPESAIIFCNMRDETTAVARFLNKQGLDAEPLSSDLSQADCERVMNRMKAKNLRYLCATDVAARGIDISNLSHVINYSVPESPEIYVHRTGRTGRAGRKGIALSMVGPRELGNFRYVRLQFGIKPEERLIPKDSIFEGKIKVPLPPVGLPQPPDPVQILIRGTPLSATGPSDLDMKIFEKLNSTANGKRVIATLVAAQLDKLSTRTKPRHVPAPRAPEGDASASGGEAPREDRPRFEREGGGDRPRFDRDGGADRPRRSFDGPRGEGDRGPRGDGDRPRRFDRDDRGPRGDRPEGDRPRRFDRDDRGPRPEGDRPEGDRGPRPEGDRGPRPEGDRGPRPEGDRPRFDADRGPRPEGDRGPRPEGERERRPWRDRNEGGNGEGRRFDRDRDRNRDRGGSSEQPPAVVVVDPETSPTEVLPVVGVEGSSEIRTERAEGDRGGRGRDRDRDRPRRPYEGPPERERGNRNRDDRGPRTETASDTSRNETLPLVTEAPADVAPVVVAEAPKVDEVARAAVDRADKKGGKKDKKPEPTVETREFWETWAEEKSTRPAPAPAAAAAPAEADAAEDAGERTERGGRSRGGRGRGGRDKDRAPAAAKTAEKSVEKAAEKTAEKSDEKAPRGKREAAAAAPAPAAAAASDASQARLFVSLGKKHGVSADDLRGLLSGPIGGDKARIGSVSLRDSHAHVRVPEDLVEAIIAGVHGTQHNAHDVTVERARA